jgi:TPR repeat protein
LLFYAAREGDAEAAFSLAGMHDPNHFTKGNPLLEKPDAYQAHKWYLAAAGKGVSKANERLRRLRQTTEKNAKKGDPAAKRLLLNWQ